MSALFVHQPPTLSQKIDSRGGLTWCKMGPACACGIMNIYYKQPPFAPVLGLFSAKYSAIWCKMQCNMPLNAVRFGAKCSAFWCKTQGKMVQNAVQNAAKRDTKSIKIRPNGINITF